MTLEWVVAGVTGVVVGSATAQFTKSIIRERNSPATPGGVEPFIRPLAGQGAEAKQKLKTETKGKSPTPHPTNGRNPSSLNLHTLICSASE